LRRDAESPASSATCGSLRRRSSFTIRLVDSSGLRRRSAKRLQARWVVSDPPRRGGGLIATRVSGWVAGSLFQPLSPVRGDKAHPPMVPKSHRALVERVSPSRGLEESRRRARLPLAHASGASGLSPLAGLRAAWCATTIPTALRLLRISRQPATTRVLSR
jgi:hypothetical protein